LNSDKVFVLSHPYAILKLSYPNYNWSRPAKSFKNYVLRTALKLIVHGESVNCHFMFPVCFELSLVNLFFFNWEFMSHLFQLELLSSLRDVKSHNISTIATLFSNKSTKGPQPSNFQCDFHWDYYGNNISKLVFSNMAAYGFLYV